MTEIFKPRDVKDAVEAVAWAVAEETPLEILGHGSKLSVGRPAQHAHSLDLSGLVGVTLYEPEELVLSARAGTAVSEIEKLLAENGQELAFEPVDLGPLLGGKPGLGTAGGLLATNFSGPRRIRAGAVRDHALGIEAVSGRGEAFKSGGRVVKNVTGYDLSKGLAGSWGTLAVLTDITFKVLPRAATSETIVITGLDDRRAVDALTQATGMPVDVSGVAHLPQSVALRLTVFSTLGKAATVIRLEGVAPSVEDRASRIEAAMKPLGDVIRLDHPASTGLWREIRDVMPFIGDRRAVWRISVAPTKGPDVVSEVARTRAVEAFYDWAGGLIWLATDEAGDAGAAAIRAAIHAHGGGHATLIRGSAALRGEIDVFEPLDLALHGLSRRLKDQFDPKRILNPGRMYAGF